LKIVAQREILLKYYLQPLLQKIQRKILHQKKMKTKGYSPQIKNVSSLPHQKEGGTEESLVDLLLVVSCCDWHSRLFSKV
jgi:hypothetical protein